MKLRVGYMYAITKGRSTFIGTCTGRYINESTKQEMFIVSNGHGQYDYSSKYLDTCIVAEGR